MRPSLLVWLGLVMQRAMADRNVTVGATAATLLKYAPTGAWQQTQDVRKTPDGSPASLAATVTNGASVSLNFTGTAAFISGWRATNQGIMQLSIDGGMPIAIDCFESILRDTRLPLDIGILGGVTGLENKPHILTYTRQANDPRATLGGSTPTTSFGLFYQIIYTEADADLTEKPTAKPSGDANASSSESSSSAGAAIGGAVGGAIVALLVAGGIIWWCRRRRSATKQRRVSLSILEETGWPDQSTIASSKASPSLQMSRMPSYSDQPSVMEHLNPVEMASISPYRPVSGVTEATTSPSEAEIMYARYESVPPLPQVQPRLLRNPSAPPPAVQASASNSNSNSGSGSGQASTEALESRLRALEESLATQTAAPPLYSPPEEDGDDVVPRMPSTSSAAPLARSTSGSVDGEYLPTGAGLGEAKGMWRP